MRKLSFDATFDELQRAEELFMASRNVFVAEPRSLLQAGLVKKLIVIGSGGHGKVVSDAAEASGEYSIVAVADDKYDDIRIVAGIPHVPVAMVPDLLAGMPSAEVIVAVGDNRARESIVQRLELTAERYATIVHPAAVISPTARIAYGTVVMAGAVLNVEAVVGRHAIVNTNAVVEHDCTVGDFAHVSPAAALAGGARLGDGAHVGIAACVLPGVAIGPWSKLGAGAAAVRDVPGGCTAVGVPAQPIRHQAYSSAL